MHTLESRPPKTDAQSFENIVKFAYWAMENAEPEDLEFACTSDCTLYAPMIEYAHKYGFILSEYEWMNILSAYGATKFLDIVIHLKEKYAVPRPFELAARQGVDLPFKFNTQTVESASYPSGHAALTRFAAHVFDHFFIDGDPNLEHHRVEMFELANRIAWGRIILGVHSLQDIHEGKRLADEYMMRNRQRNH